MNINQSSSSVSLSYYYYFYLYFHHYPIQWTSSSTHHEPHHHHHHHQLRCLQLHCLQLYLFILSDAFLLTMITASSSSSSPASLSTAVSLHTIRCFPSNYDHSIIIITSFVVYSFILSYYQMLSF
jgi:hypothetical protein